MKQVLSSFLAYSNLGDDSFREPDGSIEQFVSTELWKFVPDKPGAYILTSRNQKFIYPNGNSKVVYIGMSNNLLNRLYEHQKTLVDMDGSKKRDVKYMWYYSRYHYLRKFGSQVFWYTCRGNQKPRTLESWLLEYFYDRYSSLPIGNGVFSYGE